MDQSNNREFNELEQHLPAGISSTIFDYLKKNNVLLTITRKRSTKLGDYRKPFGRQKFHRISVNGNLNPYAFLITLTHEIAHLEAFESYKKKRIAPHGKEWKAIFGDLLVDLLDKGIFPEDLSMVVRKHATNPTASSTTDLELSQCLRKYDANKATTLNELEESMVFKIGKKVFRKGKKRRTRFLCTELSTNKLYAVSGLAEVQYAQEI